MTDRVMSDFNRFLNSHETMPLNSTFTVYFKVLSPEHINYFKNRRKAIPVRHNTGSGEPNSCRGKGALLTMPNGFPDFPTAFVDLCVVVNLIFGWLKHYNHVDHNILKTLCNVKHNNAEKNSAGALLLTYVDMFFEFTELPREKLNLHQAVPIFSKLVNAQIHVICSFAAGGPGLISYPRKNDYSLHRLYFVEYKTHLYFVDKLNTCFRYNKKCICFDCKTFYSSGFDSYHICKERRNCYFCKGTFMTHSTIEVPHEPILFCDSEINVTYSVPCYVCERIFPSQKCFDNHAFFCKKNKYGWYCKNCDTFVNLKSPAAEIKKLHKCGVKVLKCRFCYELKDDKHLCKVEKQATHKEWCNLGFLSMKFVFPSSGNCNLCFEMKKKFCQENNLTLKELFLHTEYNRLCCTHHQDSLEYPRPNVISIIHETNRFEFEEKIFCDNEFKIEVNNSFTFQYAKTVKPVTKTCYKAKRHVQNTVNIHDTLLKNTKGVTAGDKLIYFLRNGGSENCTFLVATDEIMQAVLQLTLKHFQNPDLIQKGRKILLIELPGVKVRFINFSSYIQGSLIELAAQFEVPRPFHFFPNCWNNKKNYHYEGKVPDLNDFFEFNDTENDRKLIALFYQTLSSMWSFTDQLIENCRTNCLIFSEVCLKFTKMCFNLERKIAHMTEKCDTEAVLPFGARLSSLSGFTMSLFKYYFLSDNVMYTVMLPYSGSPTSSSKGEYECLSFLAFKQPELNLQTAFNNPGNTYILFIRLYLTLQNYLTVIAKAL
jgi:hypothetical protein